MPQTAPLAVDKLAQAYKNAARELVPEYDEFGIEASLHQEDPWRERVAIAEAFSHLAPLLESGEVMSFFRLLIDQQALGDKSEVVRLKMLEVRGYARSESVHTYVFSAGGYSDYRRSGQGQSSSAYGYVPKASCI
jgi:hypothetical protein